MRTIERKVVAAMIFSNDGKLFLGRKHQNGGGVYVDCWHIPGGGIEEGEIPEKALIREVFEETGIDISDCAIKLIDDQGRGESEKILKDGEKVLCKMEFYIYKVVISDKKAKEIELCLDDDLEKGQWVVLDQLKNVKLTPPSVELFSRLGILK